MISEEIEITVTSPGTNSMRDLDVKQASFGASLIDHMFVSIYENGQWQAPAIKPVENFSLSPIAT